MTTTTNEPFSYGDKTTQLFPNNSNSHHDDDNDKEKKNNKYNNKTPNILHR